MLTWITHAPADREAAEALAARLDDAGLTSGLDNGRGSLALAASDAVVLLISQNLAAAPTRVQLEQRAINGWADGRLVLVRLDDSVAPVGLRDLPAIDASSEAGRADAWGEVVRQVQSASLLPGASGGQAIATGLRPTGSSRTAAVSVLIAILLGIGLLAALFVAGSGGFGAADPGTTIDTSPVTGAPPPPPSPPPPPTTVDPAHATSSSGIRLLMLAIVIAAFAVLIVLAVRSRRRHGEPGGEPPVEPIADTGAPARSADAVFVSYARANATFVLPVCEEVRKHLNLWIDQDAIDGGQNWAGEIVRAIRGAQNVLVMCSVAAFESDHVKREVYLAGRYEKRLLPVFIEEAVPPDDFEYFFAGLQWLNLHDTPAAERSAAVLRILGAE